MARERFIKSDLDEGLGVEGKRSRDAKADVGEKAGAPSAQERHSASDERDQDTKVKKGKSFDRLSIKEEDETDIFR